MYAPSITTALLAAGPPWENFIPALVIIPIVVIFIAISALASRHDQEGPEEKKPIDKNDES